MSVERLDDVMNRFFNHTKSTNVFDNNNYTKK